jgi:hypothetical protein
MLGSSVLLIASGLVLMFLLIALFCTIISEKITSLLSMRAVNLEQAVRQLLGDEIVVKKVLQHPLLQALGDPKRKGFRSLIVGASYIPAARFASVLIQILQEDGCLNQDAKAPASTSPSGVPGRRYKLRKPAEPGASAGLQRALEALLEQAKGDLENFGREISRWYDDIMDRASGWYRRKINIILFFIGFALAVVCNADTLMVAQVLWQDQGRRQAVSIYADKLAGSNLMQQQGEIAEAIKKNVDSIWGPLPIGWFFPDEESTTPYDDLDAMRRIPHTPVAIVTKLIGIILTALAASLGAPFWFDLLQKITKVRASGKQLLTASQSATNLPELK